MTKDRRYSKNLVYQGIVWVLVFATWYFLRVEDYSSQSMALKITAIKVVDLALVINFSIYILVPRLLYKGRYFLFLWIYLGLIALSSYAKMKLLGWMTNNSLLSDFSGHWRDRIYDNMLPHFFLVTAGLAVKLGADYFRQQTRVRELTREKLEAELNFLKSQINPHFLFNTLNSVYFLIDKENKEAREALGRFSSLLRYQLYETNGKQISIEQEIKYLQDYLSLQSIRGDAHLEVRTTWGAGLTGFSLEPLLLVPFLENAFKHRSHFFDQSNFIHISALREEGNFVFEVSNSVEDLAGPRDPHSGIGLTNVKRRLELVYPDKHQLTIAQTNRVFQVKLEIAITNPH